MRKVYPFHCDSCGYGFSRTVVEKAAGEVECPCCGNKMLFTLVAAQYPKDGTNGLRPFAEDNQCPVCRGTKMNLRYVERYKHPHTLLEHTGREEVLKHVKVKCATCDFELPPMKCADKEPPVDLSNPEWDAALDAALEMSFGQGSADKRKLDEVANNITVKEAWERLERRGREIDEREQKMINREFQAKLDRRQALRGTPGAGPTVEIEKDTGEAEETIVLECCKCGLKSTDDRNKPGVHVFIASQKGILCYSCYHEEKASREDSMKKSAGRKLKEGGEKDDGVPMCPVCGLEMLRKGYVGLCTTKGCPITSKQLMMDCNGLPCSGEG